MDDEAGRVAVQIYTTVYPFLVPAQRGVVARVTDPEPTFVSGAPHDHTDTLCLWCAMDFPGLNPLDAAMVSALMEYTGMSQFHTTFSSVASAHTRLEVTEPQDSLLAHSFGPYWYDVLSLALVLAHATTAQRAEIIEVLPQRRFSLVVDDTFAAKHRCLWLAELIVAAWRSPASTRGVPARKDAAAAKVGVIAAELYARHEGSLVGTGITDAELFDLP